MNTSAAQPSVGAALLLRSALLVLAAAVPIGAAYLVAGPVSAMALYLGIVVCTTVVPALPRRQQWIAAAWITVVAFVGTIIGTQPGPLLTAVVLCCLIQVVFLRMDARALAVAPVILIYYAFSAQNAPITVAVSTLIGAAFLIGVAALAKMPPSPRPLPWSRAIVHAVLLAVGCTALLLIGSALGAVHAHWGPLAFCLAFVPGPGTVRSALRYAAATTLGCVIGITICLFAPTWAVITAIGVGAVLIVASTLAARATTAVAGIAGTVILIGALSPDVSTQALGLGIERTGMAILAVAIGLALLLIAGPLERLVLRLFRSAPSRPEHPEPEGTHPWIR